MVAGLIFRLYYKPSFNAFVSLNSTNITVYPFQKVSIEIYVKNAGIKMENMPLGVFVNKNLSENYLVTVPSGKEASLVYNFTPSAPGTYQILAMLDPAGLYSFYLSSNTKAVATVKVLNSASQAPFIFLPSNYYYLSYANESSFGAELSNYLYSQYGISLFRYSNIPTLVNFLNPLFNLTYGYIQNLSYAYASYLKGNISSIWIKGYLSPNLFIVGADALRLTHYNSTTKIGNVTIIELSNDSQACVFYYQGWVAILGTYNYSCVSVLSNETPFELNRTFNLSSRLGEYYSVLKRGEALIHYYGILNASNQSIYYLFASDNNSISPHVCFGVITNIKNESYCSEYILGYQGISSLKRGFGLVRTTALVNEYNISVFSLINNSLALTQIPNNIGIINLTKIKGVYVRFVSGIKNTCFIGGFVCYNATVFNSNASFSIENVNFSSVKVNSIGCYISQPFTKKTLNTTIYKNSSASFSVP
ncbi:MAG: hypothetical protein QXL16_02980, partial [Candidatus Micrarchaeaceae archaeon]